MVGGTGKRAENKRAEWLIAARMVAPPPLWRKIELLLIQIVTMDTGVVWIRSLLALLRLYDPHRARAGRHSHGVLRELLETRQLCRLGQRHRPVLPLVQVLHRGHRVKHLPPNIQTVTVAPRATADRGAHTRAPNIQTVTVAPRAGTTAQLTAVPTRGRQTFKL